MINSLGMAEMFVKPGLFERENECHKVQMNEYKECLDRLYTASASLWSKDRQQPLYCPFEMLSAQNVMLTWCALSPAIHGALPVQPCDFR